MTAEELKAWRERIGPVETERHRTEAVFRLGCVYRVPQGERGSFGGVDALDAHKELASEIAFRDALLGELGRLRALLQEVDHGELCFWCAGPDNKERHADDCPAFTKEGVLR